jgi:hypothetical protein
MLQSLLSDVAWLSLVIILVLVAVILRVNMEDKLQHIPLWVRLVIALPLVAALLGYGWLMLSGLDDLEMILNHW